MKILCAAIHFDDGLSHISQPKNIKKGFVICGHRHHNCFGTLSQLVSKEKFIAFNQKNVQGFLTDTNEFVTREEAAFIAKNAGQCKDNVTKLFSEDLY